MTNRQGGAGVTPATSQNGALIRPILSGSVGARESRQIRADAESSARGNRAASVETLSGSLLRALPRASEAGRRATMTGNGERLGRDAMRGILLAGILGAATAAGQVLGPDFTSAELKCQNGIAAAESKLLDARTKCVAKCLKAARAGGGPASGGQGPAFGGATATCVLGGEKGAEAKAVAAIGKACRTDCPECYPGADCAARATQVVGEVSAAADAQILPFVYCGVQTALTKDEAK